MPRALQTIAIAPKAITWAGSTTIRRMKEKLRWRIAEGTEVIVRSSTMPDIAAAIAPIWALSKKSPTRGETASERRPSAMPPTRVDTAAVLSASSMRSSRWISAEVMPESVTRVMNPSRTVAAAKTPKSLGVSNLARTR